MKYSETKILPMVVVLIGWFLPSSISTQGAESNDVAAEKAIVFRVAKAAVEIDYTNAPAYLNYVPSRPPKIIRARATSTNLVYVKMDGWTFGLPADHFSADSRTNRPFSQELYTSKFKLLFMEWVSAEDFEPVMTNALVLQTNFYAFISSAFDATARDIDRQTNIDLLMKHVILLKTKAMIVPPGADSLFVEYGRGDFKGFISGDPARSKFIYVDVYIEQLRRFVSLGIIRKSQIQMSDIEDLIASLVVAPDH